VLEAELPDLEDIEKYSQAYAHRGFDDFALQLLERAVSRCFETTSAVSESTWPDVCGGTSAALLQRYRKSGDASKAQALLAQWQRVTMLSLKFDDFWLLDRTGALARQGKWQQVLELTDFALARMPPPANNKTANALDWSNLALFAQFANGQYARAAGSFARNRALLARVLPKDSPVLIERAREQAVLDALAQGEPLEIGWWTRGDQLSAAQFPPLSNPKDPEYQIDGLFGLKYGLQQSLIFARKERAKGSLAMATVAEGYALLMVYLEPWSGIEGSSQQFEVAQTWGKNAGKSAGELAQRAAWFSAKQKAILALRQGQSADTADIADKKD